MKCSVFVGGEVAVPQDMRDPNIFMLYKNKGNRSDCNNYHSISLLSIVEKLFGHVVLKRLQILADKIYPKSQCGFHTNRYSPYISFRKSTQKSISHCL